MTCCLAASENDAWYTLLLQEQYPFYAIFLLQYITAASREGSWAVWQLAPIVSVWGLYTGLAKVRNSRMRLGIVFIYYQIVQCMQVYMAFLYPDIGFVYIIASTIVLVHLEIATCLGAVESSLLIGKFFVMWSYYVWKLSKVEGHWSEAVVGLLWALFHLVNCAATRRAMERKRMACTREVEADKERMQALMQAIPDGVAVITEDRKVATYNRMLLRMLQLEGRDNPEKLLSPALGLLTYAPLYKKTASLCQLLLDDVVEHIARERENTSIDFGSVEYRGHYLEWRGTTSLWNQTRACILVVREVGQWVELEALAKRESEAKSALIRSVSHELRTPINAIINVSQRLEEDSSLSGEQKEQCQILISSSNFLLSDVNDLLDFSRIANQQFSLNKQLFKLEESMKSCVTLIESQCRLKRLHLCFRYDSSIPALVFNDPNRLKQVLLNLLSNALKFTVKGKIEVVVTLLNPSTAKIAVEDTGIGVSQASQKKIFTLFGKLTGNEKLNPQGCGLGLAISNTLVIQMGGLGGIHVKSIPEHGSIFSFQFPINEEMPSIEEERDDVIIAHTDSSETDEFGPLAVMLPTSQELWKDQRLSANTLIADDSDFNRMILKTMLKALGFRCDEAGTGAQALRKIEQKTRENSPYLYIFLDIEMPEMSGIEVAVELRRQVGVGTLAKAQVIGCSAYVSPEDRQSCLDAGMDFFLEKPVSKEMLISLANLIQA